MWKCLYAELKWFKMAETCTWMTRVWCNQGDKTKCLASIKSMYKSLHDTWDCQGTEWPCWYKLSYHPLWYNIQNSCHQTTRILQFHTQWQYLSLFDCLYLLSATVWQEVMQVIWKLCLITVVGNLKYFLASYAPIHLGMQHLVPKPMMLILTMANGQD